MKEYEDTIASVFGRIEMYQKAKKRRNRILGSAAILGCCGVLIVMALVWGTPELPQDPTVVTTVQLVKPILPTSLTVETETKEETEPAPQEFRGSIQCLLEENGQIQATRLTEGVLLPVRYQLHVTDIRGLDQTAVNTLVLKEKQAITQILSQYTLDNNPSGRAYGNVSVKENTLIRTVQVGVFRLETIPELVESIRLKCESGYGRAEFHMVSHYAPIEYWYPRGEEVTITGAEYAGILEAEKKGEGYFAISWRHTPKAEAIMDAQPDTDFSFLEDRLTIEIQYTDGLTETFSIEIRFDEEGNASMLPGIMERIPSSGF